MGEVRSDDAGHSLGRGSPARARRNGIPVTCPVEQAVETAESTSRRNTGLKAGVRQSPHRQRARFGRARFGRSPFRQGAARSIGRVRIGRVRIGRVRIGRVRIDRDRISRVRIGGIGSLLTPAFRPVHGRQLLASRFNGFHCDWAARFLRCVCLSSVRGRQQRQKGFNEELSRPYGQDALVMVRTSTCAPGRANASSVPMTKRTLIVCPFRLAGRLITVSMYPPESPHHACLPASGLFAVPVISPV